MATSTLRANAYRVTLEKTGMTVIRGSDLGAQPAISALRMCYEDHEIAIKVDDIDGDTVFDADDRVIFYGEAIKTDDTNTNAYWLTYGSGSGTRMTSADGTPTSATIVNTYTHPVTIERDILTPAGVHQYQAYTGMSVDTFELALTSKALVTGKIGFMGKVGAPSDNSVNTDNGAFAGSVLTAG